jgi:group I intron endonuclease
MGYIYKITNKISGKMYIGETKEEDVERRWKGHINAIKHDRGCPALQDAVRKYGINNFKFEIVVICFDENRYDMEQFYIKKFNTLVPNGYNITLGGLGGGFIGKKHTAETVAKIKEGLIKFKEENPDYFETYKEKHRKSMENVDTGAAVKRSEKWQAAVKEGRVGGGAHKQLGNGDAIRQKISAGLKRYYSENKGKTYINTEKHRVSMAKTAGIAIIKMENGTIIDTYDSIANAARSNNLAPSTLKRAVVLSKELAGFTWQKVPKDVV